MKKRVIVIGSGAAGLGAARWLIDNDTSNSLDVVVLEARDRIGGRVYTASEIAGVQNAEALGLFDMGASWIHDPMINPLSPMVKKMNLATFETDFEEDINYDLNGKRYGDKESEKISDKLEKNMFQSIMKAHGKGAAFHANDSLESLVANSHKNWTDPLVQLYLSGTDFELGAPIHACSATESIDKDWVASEDLMEDDIDDYIFPKTGFVALLEGLVTGEATDIEQFRPNIAAANASSANAKTAAENVANPIFSGTSEAETTSSASDPSNCKQATMRRPMTILFNQVVTNIEQFTEEEKQSNGCQRKCRVTAVPRSAQSWGIGSSPQALSGDTNQCEGEGIKESGNTAQVAANETAKSEGGSSVPVVYEADAVIVTVPLGVLKAGTIDFHPPLSVQKQRAIENIGFGNVVKVILEFPRVFWPTHAHFLGIADKALCTMDSEGHSNRGLLTTFLNGHLSTKKKILVSYGLGDAADVVDKMSDEELLALAMQHVRCLLQPGQALPPAHTVNMYRTKWASDPYAMGAYSYWAKGNMPGIRNDLAAREGESVWFAGEACHESSMWSSSVHGAWTSGVMKAREVAEYLNQPILTPSEFLPTAFNAAAFRAVAARNKKSSQSIKGHKGK